MERRIDFRREKPPVPCAYCGMPINHSPGEIILRMHQIWCDRKPQNRGSVQYPEAPPAGSRNN